MSDTNNTQPSDTGTTDPGPVPYDRFKEVNDRAKNAEARRVEAERAWQAKLDAQAQQMEALQRTINERIPAPEQEDEWVDPAEVALKKVAELERWKSEREEADRDRVARSRVQNEIAAAIKEAGVSDVNAAMEFCAKEYGASKFYGLEFDAATAAKQFKTKYDATPEQDRVDRIKQNAEATASAITGNGSAETPTSTPASPKRPSPLDADYSKEKLAEWEREETARILAQHRI